MLGKKGTAHAVFDPEFNKSFNIFQKYEKTWKERTLRRTFSTFF